MKQLIITLTGKKQSGKNTSCNHIVARYLNTICSGMYYYDVNDRGELCFGAEIIDDLPKHLDARKLGHFISDSVKIYSFADPLKEFCVNVLCVTKESCWGTDEQKNRPIAHLLWENMPHELRPRIDKFVESKYSEFSGITREGYYAEDRKSGPMTGREIMQIFGSEICRKMYGDCWAMATYNKILGEGKRLALICDGRFPNEIKIGKELNAKTVRLARKINDDNHISETALDNFPISDYTVYIDNQKMTVDEQCRALDQYIDGWFSESGILK